MEYSRIEVVTSIYKISSLAEALGKMGVSGMTVFQAMGCGTQKGTPEYEIGLEQDEKRAPELLPKELLMMIVPDNLVDKVVDVVKKELYTGHIGDGKIFISPISNVIRVRTGEEGMDALQ